MSIYYSNILSYNDENAFYDAKQIKQIQNEMVDFRVINIYSHLPPLARGRKQNPIGSTPAGYYSGGSPKAEKRRSSREQGDKEERRRPPRPRNISSSPSPIR